MNHDGSGAPASATSASTQNGSAGLPSVSTASFASGLTALNAAARLQQGWSGASSSTDLLARHHQLYQQAQQNLQSTPTSDAARLLQMQQLAGRWQQNTMFQQLVSGAGFASQPHNLHLALNLRAPFDPYRLRFAPAARPMPPPSQEHVRSASESDVLARRGATRSSTDQGDSLMQMHFKKGTLIQLASGELKKVEELSTEDFIVSANMSTDLKMDSSQVVKIDEKDNHIVIINFCVGDSRQPVSVEATSEHPFFVIGQGWSSTSPDRSRQLYELNCHKLNVGDMCISLTERSSTKLLERTAIAQPDDVKPSSADATSVATDRAQSGDDTSSNEPSTEPSPKRARQEHAIVAV